MPAFAGMTIKSSGRSRAQLLMRNLLVLLLSLCTLAAADAVAREPVRMLVFTKTAGFRHDSIPAAVDTLRALGDRSEEHTSELQSLMRISYAVFCLKKKKSRRKR